MDHDEDFPSLLGSPDDRDCYLGVPVESETTGPQTTNLPLVDHPSS